MKRCAKCKIDKPLADFCANRAMRDSLNVYCRSCHRIVNREARERSPRRTFSIALYRALKRTPCANPITVDEVVMVWRKQEGRCALSGITMTWASGRVLGTSISIDRIEPTKGYSPDNIRLLCHAVNCFRGTMSDAEVIGMAQAIADHARRSVAPLAGESRLSGRIGTTELLEEVENQALRIIELENLLKGYREGTNIARAALENGK